MISSYILEEYDFKKKGWFKVRSFYCNELDIAKCYLNIFRNKEPDSLFRLVGVVCV